jgi:hypothetical protein
MNGQMEFLLRDALKRSGRAGKGEAPRGEGSEGDEADRN